MSLFKSLRASAADDSINVRKYECMYVYVCTCKYVHLCINVFRNGVSGDVRTESVPSHDILVHLSGVPCGRIVIIKDTLIHENDFIVEHKVIRWLCGDSGRECCFFDSHSLRLSHCLSISVLLTIVVNSTNDSAWYQ